MVKYRYVIILIIISSFHVVPANVVPADLMSYLGFCISKHDLLKIRIFLSSRIIFLKNTQLFKHQHVFDVERMIGHTTTNEKPVKCIYKILKKITNIIPILCQNTCNGNLHPSLSSASHESLLGTVMYPCGVDCRPEDIFLRYFLKIIFFSL